MNSNFTKVLSNFLAIYPETCLLDQVNNGPLKLQSETSIECTQPIKSWSATERPACSECSLFDKRELKSPTSNQGTGVMQLLMAWSSIHKSVLRLGAFAAYIPERKMYSLVIGWKQ